MLATFRKKGPVPPPSPGVAEDLLRPQLSGDVERGRRGQQLPALVHVQLTALETLRVNLRQEVGADVPRDEARVGDDFTQEGDVVGHAWRDGGERNSGLSPCLHHEQYASYKEQTSDDIVVQGIFHLAQSFSTCSPVSNQLQGGGKKNQTPVQQRSILPHPPPRRRYGALCPTVAADLGDHGVIVDADVASLLDAAVHADLPGRSSGSA